MKDNVELETKAEHLVRYLALQPAAQANLMNMTIGRNADVLRHCLRKRLVKILPTGAKQWLDGEGPALELPLETWLEELDKPESTSIIGIGSAARAMLDEELQEHRGNPERLAAAERRRIAFAEGR